MDARILCRHAFAVVLLALTAAAHTTVGGAQSVAASGYGVRTVDPPRAISDSAFGAITNVRELSGGGVMINDAARRRIVLLDSNLSVVRVVLDSTVAAEDGYGSGGWLLPYSGDSSFFIDRGSLAMRLLDEEGRTVRVRATPRPQEMTAYAPPGPPVTGVPGFDARGRLVYGVVPPSGPPPVSLPPGTPYSAVPSDSILILAIDLSTRKLDTVASVRFRMLTERVQILPAGGFAVTYVPRPMPVVDGWAISSDGSIAIVRGENFTVEWVTLGETATPPVQVPFDWRRIGEDERLRLLDSLQASDRAAAASAYVNAMIRWVNFYGKEYPADFVVPEAVALNPGYPPGWRLPAGMNFPDLYFHACPPGVEAAPRALLEQAVRDSSPPAAGGRLLCVNGPSPAQREPPPPVFVPPFGVSPAELPDYRPAFSDGAVRADADNNVWVRVSPANAQPGGPVYDVISRSGERVMRVQLPTGFTPIGFGRNGVLYVGVRDTAGVRLGKLIVP